MVRTSGFHPENRSSTLRGVAMSVDYLNLSRAEDIKEPKEKILYRFFEVLPGALSWGTLITAFILAAVLPMLAAIFIIVFDLYWLLRISYLSFHQIVSYRQMKKNLKIDWLSRLNNELEIKNWQDIYHLIILPVFKEGIEVVQSTCQSLKEAKYPKNKMFVVLTVEERAGKQSQEMAKTIKEKFGKDFFSFLTTCHPQNIPGEIAGKGSNVAWALKQAKEKIISPLKIPKQNIIVSNFDIDTRPYPQYFACLTYNYLSVKDPLRASYQPIPIYNNNIWQAPAFSRVISTSGTFWQMMQQERPEHLVTYSAHSMPFKTLEQVGYPVGLMSVNDDSHIFWKAFFYYNGDYRVIPLHYPVSMDAVMAENWFKTAINQYKQQRRWAWGCTEIPYIFYAFLKNKKIPVREKISRSLNVIDGFWSWATSTLLIFFLGWLPLILGGESFNVSLLSYNLPRLTSNIMTIAMFGMMISAIISLLLLPPRPKNFSWFKNLFIFLQWLLLPFTLIIFGSFPALDAQARLIIKKPLGFWSTDKIRKAKN